MTPEQAKHLDFIQSIISRMAHNSFIIKGWTISIVSAILAITVKEKDSVYCYIGLIPVLVFWFLDSYYLLLERRYRELYKDVIQDINKTGSIVTTNHVESLSLSTNGYLPNKLSYVNCLKSVSEIFVYALCVASLVLVINIL